MALYLVLRDNAPSGPGTAVACRCCPAGSRSTWARRYPSDMTDAEWAVIEPLLPAPGWMLGQGGSPGIYCRRDIVNAIRYLTHNGPVWRALPADLPHWRTGALSMATSGTGRPAVLPGECTMSCARPSACCATGRRGAPPRREPSHGWKVTLLTK